MWKICNPKSDWIKPKISDTKITSISYGSTIHLVDEVFDIVFTIIIIIIAIVIDIQTCSIAF